MESFLSHALTHAGYGALIILGFLEACCVPISSEITFGFAGVLAYQGHLNLVLVIVIGSLAELGGSYLSYAVGRIGGRPLVERLARYVLITRSDIQRAERFFAGRGAWAVAVGRMLPFIRAFTSLVAGLIEVPAIQFGAFSLLGTVVYVTVLSVIGYQLGSAWGSLSHYLSIGSYVLVAVVVLAIIGFVVYRLREFRKEAASDRARHAHRSHSGQPRI
jgi:membrane protein DedA with SNARE-associated domain